MAENHVAVDSSISSRDLHRLEVFETIRREKLVNLSGLSRQVSSSRPTVSMIIFEMQRIGLLVEVSEGISTGGRKPLQLKYCPENRKAIGVENWQDSVHSDQPVRSRDGCHRRPDRFGRWRSVALATRHEVNLRSLSRSLRRTHIVTGTLGIKAVTIGAAALVIRTTPIDTIFVPENWKRQLISI